MDDRGQCLKAELFDRLGDLPLIPLWVEKHEDPVPVELLDRFQQDLETGCLDGSVGGLEVRYQQGQCDPEAVGASADPLGSGLVLVVQLVQSPQQQGAQSIAQDG